MPFVRREARHDVNGERDENVGGEDVQPDVDGQRCHEGEESGGRTGGHFEEDADAEVHERLGEIDDGLARIVDGHGADGQVGFLGCVEGTENMRWVICVCRVGLCGVAGFCVQ